MILAIQTLSQIGSENRWLAPQYDNDHSRRKSIKETVEETGVSSDIFYICLRSQPLNEFGINVLHLECIDSI